MKGQCAICSEYCRALTPVTWELVLNGEHQTFALGCCPMEADMCELFPSMKQALFKSAAAQEMLRRLVR